VYSKITIDAANKFLSQLFDTMATIARTEVKQENGYIVDTTKYNQCKLDIYDKIDELKNDKRRYQTIGERENKSVFDAVIICKVSKGKYKTTWRGISMMKDCFDMIIIQQLLWELRPNTIFETGTYTGACALWMSDTLKSYGITNTKVYTVDIDDSFVDPLVRSDENVMMKQGDAKKIAEVLPAKLLETCPHPWVVSEDCHVDLLGVMNYFHEHMRPGDYFVIEDTSPDTPLKSGQGLLNDSYETWGNTKYKVLRQFMEEKGDFYRIDSYYTDYFGYNGTYNWDGYIRRVR